MEYDYEVLEEGQGDAQDYITAMQKAINDGTIWRLQGSAGRAAMAALESGVCMLGKRPTADYYGNRIPSRDMLVAGTKGTFDYVAERMGVEWAEKMAAL